MGFSLTYIYDSAKKSGIHGKQRGGRKGKRINPLTAQRNA